MGEAKIASLGATTLGCVVGLAALALGAFCLGFIWGWRVIKKGRMPARLADSLVTWSESPAPAFHYDRLSALLIILHSLGVLTLGCLLLLSLNQAGVSPFSMAYHSPLNAWLASIVGFEDAQISKLSLFIAALSAGIAAFTCGGIVSFPFARRFIQPVRVHLHLQGISYGQYGAGWPEIDLYRVDQERRLIKIFTHWRPQAPSFVLKPPEQALFTAVQETLGELLPDAKGEQDPSQSRHRWPLGLVFLLATALLLLGAFWLYRYATELVWFIYAAGLVAYTAAGRMLEKI